MVTLCRVAAIVFALLASGACRATPLRLGELLIADKELGALWAVDSLTGSRRVFSGPTAGEGPFFVQPTDVTVGSTGDIYVLDGSNHAILHVDSRSGDRTVVSSDSVGKGPAFRSMRSFAIRDQYIYVGDAFYGGITRVDILTGDRYREAYLGSNSVPTAMSLLPNGDLAYGDWWLNELRALPLWQGLGNHEIANYRVLADESQSDPGAKIYHPTDFIVSPDGSTAYTISDLGPGSRTSVLEISLETGKQRVISSEGRYAVSRGEGPSFYNPHGITIGTDGGLFVTNRYLGLYRVDIATGDRRVFSANGVGEGPEIGEFYGVAVFVPEPASAILVSLAIVIVRSRRVRCNRTI